MNIFDDEVEPDVCEVVKRLQYAHVPESVIDAFLPMRNLLGSEGSHDVLFSQAGFQP